MGAWGTGSFQNDTALDWYEEFRTTGAAAIEEAFLAAETADDLDGLPDHGFGDWTLYRRGDRWLRRSVRRIHRRAEVSSRAGHGERNVLPLPIDGRGEIIEKRQDSGLHAV